MLSKYIRWYRQLTNNDVGIVGGKNASLGEMWNCLSSKGIQLPEGFATTADAFWDFLSHNNLKEKIIRLIDEFHSGAISLQKAGFSIRKLIENASFPPEITEAILDAYQELSGKYNEKEVDIAVRSSATAEDLPKASFAGQLESFLNVRGGKNVLAKCLQCFASLYTDRAITYRDDKKFPHDKVAVSVGLQKMVRSDLAGSGVMFTIDTDSGFQNIIEINASYGLGENIVQGSVNPDEYVIFKPLLANRQVKPIIEKKLGKKEKKLIYKKNRTKNISTTCAEQKKFVLSDEEILTLARWAVIIEEHYQKPMDIEWAKDGALNSLFIVQARPETVQSQKQQTVFHDFELKERGKIIVAGEAIGEMIASGKAQVLKNVKEIKKFQPGNILVTQITSPDWVPIMKISKGIVTDHGGRTSHAAIVSRELNLPAIVGTNDGTKLIRDTMNVTLSCAEGSTGYIYEGLLKYQETEIDLSTIKEPPCAIMINLASPDGAFRWWHLPCKGVGLARMEFIINNIIKIHPMALIHFDRLKDKKAKKIIEALTQNYPDKQEYFIDLLAKGVAKIAASQFPYPAIVRMSDFKTNEYANLIGGAEFEEKEENPMLGFRGASRYYNDRYKAGFRLECLAIKKAREELGLKNIIVMIPFCRTLEEADEVIKVLGENQLKRGINGLELYVMAEIPSNIILAKEFSKKFDGFSIGSNDLTQLTLGIDRDSEILSKLFDERNEAVKIMIHNLIEDAHSMERKVGICGQAPSDFLEFAEFLVKEKIDSISLNPDSVIRVITALNKLAS